jgi:hypothetical protein
MGREQKGHLQVFDNFDLAKKKSAGSGDQQRSIVLSIKVRAYSMPSLFQARINAKKGEFDNLL